MIIFSGPFSLIRLVPERHLLVFVWNNDSSTLDENGVQFEIGRILTAVKEYGIQNIIVDARNYAFRNNIVLQTWINRTYMPLIMDLEVKKYALIVDSKKEDELAGFEEETVLPVVEYFTESAKANEWMESSSPLAK